MSDQSVEEPAVKGESFEFRCQQCGAAVAMEPGTDSLKCGHCGHMQDIHVAPRPIVERDFQEACARLHSAAPAQLAEGARAIQCKSCGAEAVLTGQAARCAFCGSPLVVDLHDATVAILPESVLPFAVTREKSTAEFKKWIKSRWFAPSDLTRRAKATGMDGAYLPHWTYDALSITNYTGMRGEYYWVTEYYTDSKGNRTSRQVRRTHWYSASGTVQVPFDDVLVCASKTLPEKLVQELEPWDLEHLKPYDAQYLAGFVAERYKIGLEEGFDLAQVRMEPHIRAAIRRDIGGDEQRILTMDVNYANVTFKHLLLPIWISSFRYSKKVFRVMVNARTGEVQGERPWSWVKITLFVLACMALVVGGILLIARASSSHRSQSPSYPQPSYPETPTVAEPGPIAVGPGSTPTPTPTPDTPAVAPAPPEEVAALAAKHASKRGNFDALGFLKAARQAAQMHQSDAELTGFDLPVVSRGKALLPVSYRFRSPNLASHEQVCADDVEVSEEAVATYRDDRAKINRDDCTLPLVALPHCTLAKVWQRALKAGAPKTKPAHLSYAAREAAAGDGDTPASGAWKIESGDFSTTFADDCR